MINRSIKNILFLLFSLQLGCVSIHDIFNEKYKGNILLSMDNNDYITTNTEIKLTFKIKNVGKKSITINRNILPTTYFASNEHINIKIIHNNELFVEENYNKDAVPKYILLKEDKELIYKKEIDFRYLIRNTPLILNRKRVENKEYGDYSIQAIYLYGTDTIFSNIVFVKYLPE